MPKTAPLDSIDHYMKLPLCGFCTNAWDMIYMRARPGLLSPAEWLKFCRVGGCDPQVWDFLDDGTGWPIGFQFHEGGRVDWAETVELYDPPAEDNTVFHRRLSDADTAKWRRTMPKLYAEWNIRKGRGRLDANGSVKIEDIQFDEDEDEDEIEFDEVETVEAEVVDDEEIEW